MTDAEHQVTTALWYLMARIIVSVPATSCKDVYMGTVLCGMLLHNIADSKKFVPETVQWVVGCLNECFLRGGKRVRCPKESAVKKMFSLTLSFSDSPSDWWDLPSGPSSEKMSINWIWKTEVFFDTESFRNALMTSLLDCLNSCIQRTRSSSAFLEMSRAYEEVLEEILNSKTCWRARASELRDSLNLLQGVSCKSRIPLMMRTKPKEIRQLEPRFSENVGPETVLNERGHKSELSKLKRQVRQEQKGARRELRKDTFIIQEEKRKAEEARSKVLEKKHKEVMQFLETQARDSNLLKRVSKKKRKY
jgi:nucleolar protein 14